LPVEELEHLSLRAIMSRWPQTVRVFAELRFHCIGCPISDFHGLSDAAREHGYVETDLLHLIGEAIDMSVTPAIQVGSHPRSATSDADP